MEAMSGSGKVVSWRTSEGERTLEGKQPFSLSTACTVFPTILGWMVLMSQEGFKAESSHLYTWHNVICRDITGFQCFKILFRCYNKGKPILITRHFCSSHFSHVFFPRSNVLIPLKLDCMHRTYAQQILAQTSKTHTVTETHLSSMNATTSWS